MSDDDNEPLADDAAPARPPRKAAPADDSGAPLPRDVAPATTPAQGLAESAAERLARLRGRIASADLGKLSRKAAAAVAPEVDGPPRTDEAAPADPAPQAAEAAPGRRRAASSVPARLPSPSAVAPSIPPAAVAPPEDTPPLPPERAPALASQQAPPAAAARPAAARPSAGAAVLANAPAVPTPVRKRPLLRRGKKRMTSSRAALLSMTSQEAPLAEQQEDRDVFDIVEAVLMRLVGIAWLAAAILIWSRLIGYGDGAPQMSWYNLGASFVPTLVAAIVTPIVSVGLWLVSRWGAVVWAAAVLVSLGTTVAGVAEPPFGVAVLAANLLALALVGGVAVVRAWRDRDLDD